MFTDLLSLHSCNRNSPRHSIFKPHVEECTILHAGLGNCLLRVEMLWRVSTC